jgi:hypothetical protein
MVGRRGIEPLYTCVSGRPRRPAGSRPTEGRGVDPHGPRDPCRLSGPAAAPAAYPPSKRAAVPTRSAYAPCRFQGGARSPGGFTLRRGRRWTRSTGPYPHPLSRRGPPPGGFISHARKAGDLNATGLTAHRLAGEPGRLSGSPSVPPAGLEPAHPAVWAQ